MLVKKMAPVDKLGRRVLLLIDDPKLLFKTLHYFKDSEVTFNSFKQKLEQIKGKRLSKKYAEGYFYSATVFKLLVPSLKKGSYRLSEAANLLCTLYNLSLIHI